MENVGVTTKPKLDTPCTAQLTKNRTASKVGVRIWLPYWTKKDDCSKDRTCFARLVSVLTDFDVSFSFVNKVSACNGPTLCINLHRGGTWDAGKITLVTEQCRSCSLTSGQELTGLTLAVSVSTCMLFFEQTSLKSSVPDKGHELGSPYEQNTHA